MMPEQLLYYLMAATWSSGRYQKLTLRYRRSCSIFPRQKLKPDWK